ncbi:hypothetical protein DCS_03221 [Drechmeria coniospora]|uniref:Uncharacterized protein n=1 Tax=Drechmeria coniospora TaxID=98403 RepID=A0A151GYA6_DRECN|nr:hypothetical protein DCS_03221 [Drechmeria coniospora]KYK62076.1 hypothetical protein DCS_03221 [Drechmeria coniospora]ODA81313.1 hypothetical protein RJ55_04278 [Drechmeria coniospora]
MQRIVQCGLVVAALVSGISAVEPVPNSQLAAYMDRLSKAMMTMDDDRPPFYDGANQFEPTCIQNVGQCFTTEFWTRHYLAQIENVTIIPSVHVDAELINLKDEVGTIKSTKSVAVARGTTKGWTISAKATVSTLFSGKGGFAEVSGTYKDETTDLTTQTRTVEYASTCAAGRTCRIQTVTFQAVLRGVCRGEPFIWCSSERRMCDSGLQDSCSQYGDYFKKSCSSGVPLTSDCETTVQIRDGKNDLLSVVVLE